jgi:hypothetical protein
MKNPNIQNNLFLIVSFFEKIRYDNPNNAINNPTLCLVKSANANSIPKYKCDFIFFSLSLLNQQTINKDNVNKSAL